MLLRTFPVLLLYLSAASCQDFHRFDLRLDKSTLLHRYDYSHSQKFQRRDPPPSPPQPPLATNTAQDSPSGPPLNSSASDPIIKLQDGVAVLFANSSLAAPQGTVFQIDLNCNMSAASCNRIGQAAANAATWITSLLDIRESKKIKLNLAYRSFCTEKCDNKTLGWSSSSAQWTLPGLQGIDPNYLYPQSLAKQLSPFDLQWADYDIITEFNSDVVENKIWFKADNTTIGPKQIDFEYLLLHEIIHGLGVMSSWAPYFLPPSSFYTPLISPPFTPEQLKILTPPPSFNQDPETNLTRLSGFLPSVIFDKYLLMNGVNVMYPPLDEMSQKIRSVCYEGNGTLALNFVQSLLESPEAYNLSRLLYDTSGYPNSVLFRFPPNVRLNPPTAPQGFIVMQTSNMQQSILAQFPEHPGAKNASEVSAGENILLRETGSLFASTTPFSHFADGSPIMKEEVIYGKTLEEITGVGEGNRTANPALAAQVLGNAVLGMLEALGYSTKIKRLELPAAASADPHWLPRKPKCRPVPSHNAVDDGSSSKASSLPAEVFWGVGTWLAAALIFVV
ncbi:uncharacterized protein VTP21DRAFT_3429 [Calcarisporiella thermophila]|uniref:uncharacterized protein n=1 Tax=Calcarisporiella thermophila TaxID=911321 RepID=UPI0037449F30